MLFTRMGDQLYRNEFNVGLFFEYLDFEELPLNPEREAQGTFVEDPRDQEMWMTLYCNWGILRNLEAGLQIPAVFLSDYRDSGVGRIGMDLRYLLLQPNNNFGFGVATTAWVNFTSFSDGITSNETNGGGELNFTFLAKALDHNPDGWVGRHILELLSFHLSLGWGYEDYMIFDEIDPGAILPASTTTRDPYDLDIIATQFYSVSLGIEYEVYDRLFLGAEVIGKQWPDVNNDNNCNIIFPEVSYTVQGRLNWSIMGAFGMACSQDDHNPEYMGIVGFSFHVPGEQEGPSEPELAPAPPPPPPPPPIEIEPPPVTPPPVEPERVSPRLPIPATNPQPPPTPPAYNPAQMATVLPSNFNTRPGSRKTATRVLNVKASDHENATRIIIETDGYPAVYDDFYLMLPNRLAIDIYDVTGSFNTPVITIGTNEVRTLRWGPHPGKVRIVLDLPEGDLPYYTINRTSAGIEVIVYSTRTISEAPLSDYTTYTAGTTQTPMSVAMQIYGDSRAWRRIVMANPEVFPYEDPFPEHFGSMTINPGVKLRIPERH